MKKKSATAKLSLTQILVDALEDLKAQKIVVLDVRELTDVTDTLIIASGSSNRQVRALAEHTMEEAKKKGYAALGVEGLDGGEWVLADFADAVVHVMLPETREFYDLERLWQTQTNTVDTTAAREASIKTRAVADKTTGSKTTAKKVITSEVEFDSQADSARARKKSSKPAVKAPSAKVADSKSLTAGQRAKTGTRKPAAAKAGTSGKSPAKAASATTKSAAKKSAAAKPAAAPKKPASKPVRGAIGISNTAKPKKPATRKPRAS